MPTVPVSHAQPEVLSSAARQAQPLETRENISQFQLRQQLAEAVRAETAKKGTVTTHFLDQFAATHLSSQDENDAAVFDYEALRYAAQAEEKQNHAAQQQDGLRWEGSWVSQVGQLAPDHASLQTYISEQLPLYKNRLEQAGVTPQQAAQAVKEVHTQTVEKHLLRSLAGGDWQTAGQVLQGQADSLPAEKRERLAWQVRQCFAQNKAEHLWRDALQKAPDSPYRQAVADLQESDEELQEEIGQVLAQFNQTHHRQIAAEQARWFGKLAKAPTSQAYQLLTTQQVLPAEALSRVRRALCQADQETSPAQRAWFMKNYFKDTLNADDAFDKGLCSARDYFNLKTVQQRRKSGQELRQEKWLCRGIETWMKKQGFEEKDIAQVSYEVLSGDTENEARATLWKQIKTLLTC